MKSNSMFVAIVTYGAMQTIPPDLFGKQCNIDLREIGLFKKRDDAGQGEDCFDAMIFCGRNEGLYDRSPKSIPFESVINDEGSNFCQF